MGARLSVFNTATIDPDGNAVSLSYQWRVDGAAIPGATAPVYQLTPAEWHKVVTCAVTASDQHGGSVTSVTNGLLINQPPPGTINTVAGGGVGDGEPAVNAPIYGPRDAVFDAAGNLYIAEYANNRIRKVDSYGIITTIAGTGVAGSAGDNGPAVNAQLNGPASVLPDAMGNLYIAEYLNHRIRKIDTAGIITTVAGSGIAGFAGDNGPAPAARLRNPAATVMDAAGNLYIAEYGSHRIRKVDATGTITTVAGTGTAGYSGDGGPAVSAGLSRPTGLALDAAGGLYIADFGNYRIRRVDGLGTITTIAGAGTAGYAGDGGPAVTATFNAPWRLALDAAGNLFVVDSLNYRIRKIDTFGTVTTIAGNGTTAYNGNNIPATAAALFPVSVSSGPSGNLYLADNNGLIREISPTGRITTVAGNGSSTYAGDSGNAVRAKLYFPGGVRTDTAGNRYIADSGNNRIRKVDSSGTISTIAGAGPAGYAGDGGPARAAQLNGPQDVAIDSAGNIYIADSANHRIRRIEQSTGIISTIAGNGQPFFCGDNGPAHYACLNYPGRIAVSPEGNLYIADYSNQRIRRVELSTGTITTVVGTGTAASSGDGGPATAAAICGPAADVDHKGNLYIAEDCGHRIRTVDRATGIITTIAGTGTAGYAGDNGPALAAKLNAPSSVAADLLGNIYVADTANQRVRKVDQSTGIITTLTGLGTGFSGDNGPAVQALLNGPTYVHADRAGNIHISDQNNQRIRMITELQPPILTTVHIASNNADPAYARSGDAITVSILADEEMTAPTVLIAGKNATVSGSGRNWSGATTMTAGDAEGGVPVAISGYADLFGNAFAGEVTATTDASRVLFDRTGPALVVAVAADTYHVDVTFSEAMNAAAALNRQNYAIDQGITISTVVPLGGSRYRLVTSRQAEGANYTLTALSGLLDLAGNSVIPANGSVTFVGRLNQPPVFGATPTISTVTTVTGNTLSLVNTAASDGDGEAVTVTYQWQADAVDIAGATAETFTVSSAQAHKTITCTVTASDGKGGITVVTTAGVAVANSLPVFTGTPEIDGVGVVGNLLKLRGTNATDIDADTVTLSYQWQADNLPIAAATAASWQITPAVAHKTITCVITANDSHGGIVVMTTAPLLLNNSLPELGIPVTPPQYRTSIGGAGTDVGMFQSPAGVTFDRDGNMYVAECVGNRIQKRDLAGVWTVWAGAGADPGQFSCPFNPVFDGAGNVYIADYGNSRVQMRDASGTWSVIGATGGEVGQFGHPWGVVLDNAGNLYVADYDYNRIQMRDPSGAWTVLASAGGGPGQVYSPTELAMDGVGNLYVLDSSNGRIQIRNSAGFWSVSSSGTFDGGEMGMALGRDGTIVVANYGVFGGAPMHIRNPQGVWTDWHPAELNMPYGMAFDRSGALYIADFGNNVIATYVMRSGLFRNMPLNGTLAFTAKDFTDAYYDADTDAMTRVKITALPAHGVLKLGSTAVAVNDEIVVTALGTLVYTPSPDYIGPDSFGWNAADGTAYAAVNATVDIYVNALPLFTGTPAISGTVAVGQAVTVTGLDISDPNNDTVSFTYQWLVDNVPLSGAINSQLVIPAFAAHKSLSCQVTANDGHGGSVAATTANVPVVNSPPYFSIAPRITGTPTIGTILGLSFATYDVDLDARTLSYQWKADNANISGATGTTYTLSANDIHKTITCDLTAVDTYGGTVTAATNGVVIPNILPVFTGVPALSGTFIAGNTVSVVNTGATDGDGDTVTRRYQWQADNVDIAGATGSTYLLSANETNKVMSCVVTIDDGFGGIATVKTAGLRCLPVWSAAGSPWVISGAFVVNAGEQLLVEPGTTVRFENGGSLQVFGILTATGTAGAPIIFDGTTAQAGWWRGIRVEDGGVAALGYVEVRHAGYNDGTWYQGVYKTGVGSFSLTNSKILNSASEGVRIATDTRTRSESPVFVQTAGSGSGQVVWSVDASTPIVSAGLNSIAIGGTAVISVNGTEAYRNNDCSTGGWSWYYPDLNITSLVHAGDNTIHGQADGSCWTGNNTAYLSATVWLVTTHPTKYVINNNVIDTTAGNGITLQSIKGAIEVSGNTVRNAATGLALSAIDGVVDVNGNTIENNRGNGVDLSAAGSGVTLSDNIIRNNSGWGINLTASSKPLLLNNSLQGNVTGAYNSDSNAPLAVAAVAGNGLATVSFLPPVGIGLDITGYIVTSHPGEFTASGTASPIVMTGLANGVPYTFTVAAAYLAGFSSSSVPSNTVIPAAVPDAPTGVVAVGEHTRAVVSFVPPAANGSAIVGYTVVAFPGGRSATGAVSPIVVDGLTNGTAYTFTVTAANGVGTGPASNPSSSVIPGPTAPDAPTAVTALRGNGQAVVSFAPPAANGSDITGYTVVSAPDYLTASGTASPITVTGLTNGTTYTFTVVATNGIGTGMPSLSSNSVTPATLPGSPVVRSVVGGNSRAIVAFSAPISDGGSPITGYTVVADPNDGIDHDAGSTLTTHTITGLINGTSYTFTVKAVNEIGTGPASVPSSSVTCGPETCARVPAGLVAWWQGEGNGDDIVGGNSGTALNGATFVPGNVGQAFSFDGNRSYVRRALSSGLPIGNASRTYLAWIKPVSYPDAGYNGIVAHGPQSCGNASLLSVRNDGRLSMSFWCNDAQQTEGPAAALNEWSHVAMTYDGGTVVRFYLNGLFVQESTLSGGVPATTIDGPIRIGSTDDPGRVFNGLIDEVQIFDRALSQEDIAALYAANMAGYCRPQVPEAPQLVSATAGYERATVRFNPPPADGGSAISGYTVFSNPPGGVDTNAGSVSLSHVVTGLTNGVAYTFTAIATNFAGNSPASAASSSITPGPGVPDAPVNLTAVPGDRKITVSFSPPAANGSTITGYTVVAEPGTFTATGTASPITVTGLDNGIAYTVAVTATNSYGSGPAAVFAGPLIPASFPTAPTQVFAVRGDGHAVVSFTLPEANGSAIIGYTVTTTPGGITATDTSSPITVIGLDNGTAYTFTVKATNNLGDGPQSLPTNRVTSPGMNPVITPTAGSFQTISGTKPAGSGIVINGIVRLQPDPQTTWSYALPLTEGVNRLFVAARDASGTDSAPIMPLPTVLLDTTPPFFSVDVYTNPARTISQIISGRKEPGSIVKVNGTLMYDAADRADTWSREFTLTDGLSNRLAFTAADGLGNVTTRVVDILCDLNPPPPLPLGALLADGSGKGTTVTLSWPSYPEPADLAYYRIYYAAAAFTAADGLAPVSTVTRGSRSVTVTGLTSGNRYYFAVVPVDLSGNANTGVFAADAVPVDTLPPEDVTGLNAAARYAGSEGNQVILSWVPSANSSNDLTAQMVYMDAGQGYDAGVALAATATGYTKSGLADAVSYRFKVTAKDAGGRESGGAVVQALTRLANPAGLQASAGNSSVALSWTPVPSPQVKFYNIYRLAADTVQNSVAGMQLIRSQSATAFTDSGLINGVVYQYAVTTVNTSGAERNEVQSVAATPRRDATPPTITTVNLSASQVITTPFTVMATAQDSESAMHRIELRVDDALLFTANGDSLNYAWNILDVADGNHLIKITAYDQPGNQASVTIPVVVNLASPPVPAITGHTVVQMAPVYLVNLAGTTQPGALVSLKVNDLVVASQYAVNGSFSFERVPLVEGNNALAVKAGNRGGDSPYSGSYLVPVDTLKPPTPTSLAVKQLSAGTLQFSWSPGAGEAARGYYLYQSLIPFTAKTDAGVSRAGTDLIITTVGDYLPPDDTSRYYAVSAVDTSGNESPLSNVVQIAGDRILPAAQTVTITRGDGTTSPDNIYGPGVMKVAVVVTKPLSALPFFSLEPAAGSAVIVYLNKIDDTHFEGNVTIDAAFPHGAIAWKFSGKDLLGNRGLSQGVGPVIDVRGPSAEIKAPLKVLQTAAGPVVVTLVLDEPSTTTPVLELRSVAGPAVPVTGLVSGDNGVRWNGVVDAAGLPDGTAQFKLLDSTDRFGNKGTAVGTGATLLLYQTTLAPPPVPDKPVARPAQGRAVQLAWNKVADAVAYNLYRRGAAEADALLVATVTGDVTAAYTDIPPVDGEYRYAVSAVGLLQAESGRSAETAVIADGTPPAVPAGLSLTLTGNGVVASWDKVLPPAETPVFYRLYRSSGTIVDVIGRDALANFKGNQALDPAPTSAFRFYAVTALDALGNESPPSPTLEINFPVAPVRNLLLSRIDDGKPALSWEPGEADLQGYYIYRNGSRVNLVPTISTSFTDGYFSGGSVRYGVAAVSSSGTESPMREVTLPDIGLSLKAGAVLHRGVLETVPMVLTLNAAATAGVTVDAVAIRIGTLPESSRSGPFELAPGMTLEVTKVAAADTAATQMVPVVISSIQTPFAGTTVRISRSTLVSVVGSAAALELFNEPLKRGELARVRLKVNNIGSVASEIVTSENSGPSSQVVVSLKDQDGNLLAQGNLNQRIGATIIDRGTYATARIEPGLYFLSEPIEFMVPYTVADATYLEAHVQHLWHAYGEPDQVMAPGLTSGAAVAVSGSLPAAFAPQITYRAVARVDQAVYQQATPILITGQALQVESGAPVPAVPVKITVSINGFDRSYQVTTGLDGSFSYLFTPADYEAGSYVVWASHPQLSDRAVQAQFSIIGMRLSPAVGTISMLKNQTYDFPVMLSNLSMAPLTDLNIDLAVSGGIQATLDSIGDTRLAGNENRRLSVRLTPLAGGGDAGSVVLVISSAEGVSSRLVINVALLDSVPLISMAPSYLDLGIIRGTQKGSGFRMVNTGTEALRNARFEGPSLPWIAVTQEKVLGDIVPGGGREIGLVIKPGENVVPGIYDDRITIYADNHLPFIYNLQVTVTSNAVGNVMFSVLNELMSKVANASVTIQNQSRLDLTYTQTTGSDGAALFFDVPEGRYSFHLSAAGVRPTSGSFVVQPGVTVSVPVALEVSLVNIEWSVTPVVIEDRYDIRIVQTFETNVPTPVLVAEPANITLPLLEPGQVYNGEYSLTNYGLMATNDLTVKFPLNIDDYDIEVMTAALPGKLNAMQKVQIPFRVSRRSTAVIAATTIMKPNDLLLNEVHGYGGSTTVAKVCYKNVLVSNEGKATICPYTDQQTDVTKTAPFYMTIPYLCSEIISDKPPVDPTDPPPRIPEVSWIDTIFFTQSAGQVTIPPRIDTPLPAVNPCECKLNGTPCSTDKGSFCSPEECQDQVCVVNKTKMNGKTCNDQQQCTSFDGTFGVEDKCSNGVCKGNDVPDKIFAEVTASLNVTDGINAIMKAVSFLTLGKVNLQVREAGASVKGSAIERCCENMEPTWRKGEKITGNVKLVAPGQPFPLTPFSMKIWGYEFKATPVVKVGLEGSIEGAKDNDPCGIGCDTSYEGAVKLPFGFGAQITFADPSLLQVDATGGSELALKATYACTKTGAQEWVVAGCLATPTVTFTAQILDWKEAVDKYGRPAAADWMSVSRPLPFLWSDKCVP